MSPERDDPSSAAPDQASTPDRTAEAAGAAPAPDELRRISEEISALYPPPRLGTELVLLEVNPHRAHAYWNVDVEDYQAARKRSGLERPPLVLRLYDVTGLTFDGSNAHQVFDIEIQGLQGHWYLDLWKDGRTHIADLGFRRDDGSLVCLARSNPVSTPAAAESAEYHTLALDTAAADPSSVKLTDLVADAGLNGPAFDPETSPADAVAPPAGGDAPAPAVPFVPPDHVPTDAPAGAAYTPSAHPPDNVVSWPVPQPVSADDRREEVQAFFARAAEPSAPASQPWHAPDSPPGFAARSNAAAPGGSGDEDEGGAGWPSAEELARHVPDTSGAAPVAPAPVKHDPPPAVAPEAAPPAPAPAGTAASPGSSPMPLDSYVSLSSMESGRREVSLEVNAELHIFGRAKPGTELTLYGQRVPLRPDGTFSVRKPLPQGAVVLPLLAVDPPPRDGT